MMDGVGVSYSWADAKPGNPDGVGETHRWAAVHHEVPGLGEKRVIEREGLGCQARCTLDLSLSSSRRLNIDFERESIVDW